MFYHLLSAVVVSLINFALHAVVTGLIVVASRHIVAHTEDRGVFVRVAALMLATTVALACAHVTEIAVWASFFALADIGVKGISAFEFAFENYTALGYGDVIPTANYRLMGPITALNGLLLIGWSVAIIFEVLRMAEIRIGRPRPDRD